MPLNRQAKDTIRTIVNSKHFQVLGYILTWYILSISLHVYNTWLFSKKHYDFPFPLLTTTSHLFIQFCLSAIAIVWIYPKLTPETFPNVDDFVTKLLPCGLGTALDIGLSTSSLKSISLSFYTMVKSSAPVFVVLFAFAFGLEKPTLKIFLTIIVICIGVFLMVSTEKKESDFDFWGYFQVQTAAICAGLRWTLTQILLNKQDMGMNHPLATNLYLSPIVGFLLFISFGIIEGFDDLLHSRYLQSISSFLSIVGIIGFGGFLAFFMTLAEFQLITSTSVVTFTIAGIFKEIATIATAATVFHDSIHGDKVTGLIISLFGIALYNYFKLQSHSSHSTHQSHSSDQNLDLDEEIEMMEK